MKRDFEEIKNIMDKINNPSNTPLAGFKPDREWWAKWDARQNDSKTGFKKSESLPPNFIINRRANKSFDIPESALSDVDFAKHFKHTLKLNVLGVVCRTCNVLIERADIINNIGTPMLVDKRSF